MNYELFMLGGIFIPVVLCTSRVYGLVSRPKGVKRRLMETGSQSIGLEGEGASTHNSTEEKLLRFLRPLTQKMSGKEKPLQSTVRKKLIRAGFYGSAAVEKYYAWRLVLAVAITFGVINYENDKVIIDTTKGKKIIEKSSDFIKENVEVK